MAPRPSLASHLKARDLAPVFARHGRVHIPGAFDDAFARHMHQALSEATPWRRSLAVGGRYLDLGEEEFAALGPDNLAALEKASREEGHNAFRYAFDAYRVSDHMEAGQPRGHAAEDLWRFVNSDAFLGFIRELTGEPACAYADAQGTRYRKGDFLSAHDDKAEGKDRLFAFVMNFTPIWRADWGGLLLFLDADGHVAEGYTPAFNALNLFRVPQKHAVTQVTDLAGAACRYAVTGWIRSRPPEGVSP
ncbi:2OG-Fe(II) oxygenase family protein [Brevundimonas sp. 2R-24]|uniref:2OG-Fe(II) oxygenase family protein n=1 Tax=Peiella sedimenti TaxID=3061083 RepID=A0ABT8SL76_9CAUL|nr:2OG-Fe(II) oxygenase family protein [Caulobacteraceae bacterium XZ-24]